MAGLTLASPTAEAASLGGRPARYVSPARETWRRFRRHRLAVVGLVILAVMLLGVAVGPLAWRVPINDIDFAAQLTGPSWSHPFGTDDLGQDLLARMLYGGRISLAVGLAAMVVAVAVGTIVGALAGVSRGARRHRADVAHRPVPFVAGVAAAAAGHVPVPRHAKDAGWAAAWHLSC